MTRALALLAIVFVLWAASDEERFFPVRDRLAIHAQSNQLTGNPVLPSGTLAEYKSKAGAWQLFLVRTPSPEKAAFLLLDYKKTLKEPHYLAHMGGFFGADAGRPAYVFAKGPFLAGVVGLSQEKADVIAREFAARLPLK